MPHQQKLVHIQEVTGVPPGGFGYGVNPGFLINAQNEPSLSVARHETTVEVYGADPGADFRWFTTPFIANSFVVWCLSTNGGYNLHIVSHIFHSICFDISSSEQPY